LPTGPTWAAAHAPSPLLVQYNRDDPLFSADGMQAAHARIASHYEGLGRAANYKAEFYAGPHKFDLAMQESAFGWLVSQLQS
jgi:hypothetical protein